MKKYVQEPTDRNIWVSIQNNTFDRNNDVKKFIESLNRISGSACISLNAKWGDGKTFFVRQVEETLKYVRLNQWKDEENVVEKLQSYTYLKNNGIINSIKLRKSYLPIYYNAWMYDNHSDPIISLLLVMTKVCKGTYETRINSETISKKILGVLSSLPIQLDGLQGLNIATLIEKIRGQTIDILSSIQTEEKIRERIKEIFNDIIVEKAQKLIIFVDELDRCRPSFAVEMLERIKHYFEDDRIIVVVSVNKDQLIHTIGNYYGQGFDATRYLNKFFDENIDLPEIDDYSKRVIQSYSTNKKDKFFLSKLADQLGEYYRLSIREVLIFRSRIENVPKQLVNYRHREGCFVSLFVACMILLDIVDVKGKKKFSEGKSEFVANILPQIECYRRFVFNLFGDSSRKEQEEKFKSGHEEIIKIYKCVFNSGSDEYYELFKIDGETKQKCIAASNGYVYDYW